MRCRMKRVRMCWLSACVLLAVCGVAQTSGTGAVDWRKKAEEHLRGGRKLEAAQAFEQVVRQEPVARLQLAPMLARLYAELGSSDKALGWARIAMERSPDPRAYLAGAHASLGQFKQAQAILGEELAKSNPPPRTVALSWQLADVQLKQGETNAALVTLDTAARAVEGTPEAAMAEKRARKLRACAGSQWPAELSTRSR